MFLHEDDRLHRAWAPWFSHEYINYCAAQALPALCNLPPVPVRNNPYGADPSWPPGPHHRDLYKESFREARSLDPLGSFDYAARNGDYGGEAPPDTAIEPWKVLVIYGTEPDLKLDCDLFLHKKQKLTGGSHGWRHMEFGVLGMTVGMVRESFRYHRIRARKAFGDGNEYWGWRYLSRCTHYLADLGNPFHVKALPGPYLIRRIASVRALMVTASAIHKSYEIYVERRFREGFSPFCEALAHGAGEGIGSGDVVDRAMDRYVAVAKKRFNPLFYHFIDFYGEELVDAFGVMKEESGVDASELVSRCASEASRLIFGASKKSSLESLDRITVEILHDVGRMVGSLLGGFVKAR